MQSQPASATKPGLDVVIVGAGIAGLTAALTLSKLANRVTLLERAAVKQALARWKTRRLQKVTSLQGIADDLARLSGLAAGWRITIRDLVIRQGIRLPRLMESQIRRGSAGGSAGTAQRGAAAGHGLSSSKG
jgi:glycine/D-amino acid oxidase-like deaminating enzyme